MANERQAPQSDIKQLISKGLEQGYLTYAEVNDHLPDDIVDPEQIEDIIGMINGMGIEVHEVAPDAETLLLAGTSGSGREVDDTAAEEAAADAVRARRRGRPHHRPGAHVHARDGHGRTADARRRNRHRQAHRGRPEPDALRAGELPVVDPAAARGLRPAQGRQEAPGRDRGRLQRPRGAGRRKPSPEVAATSRPTPKRKKSRPPRRTRKPRREPVRIRSKSRAAWRCSPPAT